jgi:predicted tellurium resistance membrane protein TerC
MIADVTMSLDNIVAIGALAHQQVGILILGLTLSILLLIIGSALVSELISRVPWLIVIASFILAWVSSDLVWNDLQRLPFVQSDFPFHLALLILFFLVVLAFTLITRRERVLAAIKLSR